jgi:predicted TIM-barrel fold metal-dependent hydrolase
MKIIDNHRHIGLCGSRGNPSVDDIIRELDALSIDHAIVAPGEAPRKDDLSYKAEVAETYNLYDVVEEYLRTGTMTPEIATLQKGVPYHDEVLNAARTTDGRLLGCWFLNPHLGEREFSKIRSAVQNDGFKYIKLHPPKHAFAADDLQLLDPVMALARELNIPVWYHSSSGPGTEVKRIARLAGKFPDVNVIMGHVFILGFFSEEENIRIVVKAANKHKNLWVDLCHARPASLKAIFEQGPQDRIMFGTDEPWNSEITTDNMLQNIRSAAGGNQVLLEKALGANASKVYRIE